MDRKKRRGEMGKHRPPEEWETLPAEPKKPPPTEAETVIRTPSGDDGATMVSGPATVAPTGDPLARDDPSSRKVLGPYQIREEIGRGGMGVVYRAFHGGLKREVALKVLIAGEDASEEAITRFHREAEAVAKLGHHPNIVPVYDIGREGRLHYFAMHFVKGRALDRLIDEGEVTPRKAALLARKTAIALAHAHGHGVLHRDIKPANILIAQDGEPQITDFGLARDVHSEESLTQSGTTMGSPNYMSPEQADGRIEEIDERTDVYSLGATLYEMLALRPPFEGASPISVIKQVILDDPASPRKWNPSVPRDLETICMKTLEKDKARRYESAEALAEDLRRFLEHEPIAARPASLVYRAGKRVKRNPAAYMVGSIASLLLIGALAFFLGVQPALERSAQMDADREALSAALEKHLAPEREAERLLAEARNRFDAGAFTDSGAVCREILERFAALQGAPCDSVPDIRFRDLLKLEFRDLSRPRSLPLPEAAALLAESLDAMGETDAARAAWARAYWRARQGRPGEDGASMVDDRVLEKALRWLGNDLLRQGEFRRALGTFRELQALGKGPEAALGLAKACLGKGSFEEALWFARSRLGTGAGTSQDAVEARDMVAFLETVLPCTRFSSPTFPSLRGGPMPVLLDLDGDGRDELLWVFCDFEKGLGFHARAFEGVKLEPRLDGRLRGAVTPGGDPGHLLAEASDLDGDGKTELVIHLEDPSSRTADLSVHRWTGDAFEPVGHVRDVCHSWTKALCAGDLDGDGRKEILVGLHSGQQAVHAYRWREGRIELLCRIDLPSFLYGLDVAKLGGGPRMLLSVGPYTTYRIMTASVEGDTGRVAADPQREPFRCLANSMVPFEDGTGFAFTTGKAGLASDWKVSVEDREKEPGAFLEPGLYSVRVGERGLETPAPLVLDPLLAGGAPPQLKTWVVGGARRFLVADESRIFLGPVGTGRDWVRLSSPSTVGKILQGELDGDPHPEFVRFQADGVLVVMGCGVAEGIAAEKEASRREGTGFQGDPALAIADSLREMGAEEAAVDVYETAARETRSQEVRGAALLGMADALAQQKNFLDASKAYEPALAVPSARARAASGKAACLLRLESWKPLADFLDGVLAEGKLPPNVSRELEKLKSRVDPLASMGPVLALGRGESVPDSARVFDPLALRSTKDGLVVGGDGFRHTQLLVPLRYSGEPFRIEATFRVDRFEWANFLHLGLLDARVPRKAGCAEGFMTQTNGPVRLALAAESGDDTHHPSLFFFLLGSVRVAGKLWHEPRVEVAPYPPPYPMTFHASLEYRPNLDEVTWTLRDARGNRLCTQSMDMEVSLPPGEAWVGIVAGPGHIPSRGWGSYQARLLLERFELFAPSRGTFLEVRQTPHPEDLLSEANAHLVAGRVKKAIEMYDALIGELQTNPDAEPPGALCAGPGREWPAIRARAHLFRSAALFRGGQQDKGIADAKTALDTDPAKTVFLLRRDFYHLDRKERDFFARALREKALENGGSWFIAFLEDLVREQGLSRDEVRELADAWKSSGSGEEARLHLLGNSLVGAMADYDFADRVLAGTPAEARWRDLRFRYIKSQSADPNRIWDVYVIRKYEDYLEDYPDDPRVMREYAFFLAECPRIKARNPRRAEELSTRLVESARRAGPPQNLALSLDLLASARAAGRDFKGAVEAGEEAVRTCPKSNRELLWKLERRLSKYRGALGGD